MGVMRLTALQKVVGALRDVVGELRNVVGALSNVVGRCAMTAWVFVSGGINH
jgi:hypothetical protein